MLNSDAFALIYLAATLIYFSFATLLAVYDYQTGLLPDKLTLSLLWCGLLFHSIVDPARLNSAVYGAISGYLSLWFFYWVFFWFSKKEGLGYGDFKLLAAIGAWNGWESLALILVIASVAGIITFITLHIIQQKSIKQLPFGPYLAMSGWGEFLWQLGSE